MKAINNNTETVIQHTKGEWEAKKITYSQIIVGIKNYGTENNYRDDNHCGQIAVITGWDGDKRAKLSSEDESNAARIVKCVNSHDALIDALKTVIESMQKTGITYDNAELYNKVYHAHKNAQ